MSLVPPGLGRGGGGLAVAMQQIVGSSCKELVTRGRVLGNVKNSSKRRFIQYGLLFGTSLSVARDIYHPARWPEAILDTESHSSLISL